MSIKDLIAAAYNKDATAFESAFQSVMQDKVSAAVQNAFTAEEAEEDLDEEVEELDELSKNTVRNYYNKAGEQGRDITTKMMVGGGDWSKDGKDTDTLKKRAAGRAMALKRRSGEVKMSEESGQIDELSDDKLKAYHAKAGADRQKAKATVTNNMNAKNPTMGGIDKATDAYKRFQKRGAGMTTAANKMSEETEELDEISASTLGSYIRKSSKDYEASMKKRDAAIDDSDRDTARAMGMRARKRGLGTDMAVDKLKGNRYVKVPAAIKMSEETEE